MPDYHSPPFTFPVGHPLTADDLNDYVRDNTPYIWDFPAFDVKQIVTPVDMFQGVLVIPAGVMGERRQCTIWVVGTLLNGTGSARAAPAWSVQFDTNLLIDSGTGQNIADSGALGGFNIVVRIQQSDAVNAQEISMQGMYWNGSDGTDFTTGDGVYRNVAQGAGGIITGRNTTAVDFSPGGTLQFMTKCSTTSASYVVTMTAGKAWIL